MEDSRHPNHVMEVDYTNGYPQNHRQRSISPTNNDVIRYPSPVPTTTEQYKQQQTNSPHHHPQHPQHQQVHLHQPQHQLQHQPQHLSQQPHSSHLHHPNNHQQQHRQHHHLHHRQTSSAFDSARPPSMSDFDVIKILGQGTYGKVYLVRSRLSGERQVIKQIPLSGMTEKQRADTFKETTIHSQIHHPQIILYHGCFTEDDFLYIQMEYAERGDLMQLIEAHKGNDVFIREDAIWEYLAQICHGLSYLHKNNILHRDIKARNIFLDSELNVKIGDLGLGRELGPASRLAYTAVGTPLYFSPEMCQEEGYNDKCDVWALGCLIFEMSALKPPFFATNQLALIRKICEEDVELLPSKAGYSEQLQFMISQMLIKDPEKRPSIQQILDYGPVQQRQYELQLRRERKISTKLRDDLKNKHSNYLYEIRSLKKENDYLKKNLMAEEKKYQDARAMQAEVEKQRLVDQRHYERQLEILRTKLAAANDEIEYLSLNQTPSTANNNMTNTVAHQGLHSREVSQSFDLGSGSSSSANGTSILHRNHHRNTADSRNSVRNSGGDSDAAASGRQSVSNINDDHSTVRATGIGQEIKIPFSTSGGATNVISRSSRETPRHHSRRPVSKSLSPNTRCEERGLHRKDTNNSNGLPHQRVLLRKNGNRVGYSPAAYTNDDEETLANISSIPVANAKNQQCLNNQSHQQPRSKSEPLLSRRRRRNKTNRNSSGVGENGVDGETFSSPSSNDEFRFHPVVPDEDEDLPPSSSITSTLSSTLSIQAITSDTSQQPQKLVTPRGLNIKPLHGFNTPSPSFLCPPPKLPRMTSLTSLLTSPATVAVDIESTATTNAQLPTSMSTLSSNGKSKTPVVAPGKKKKKLKEEKVYNGVSRLRKVQNTSSNGSYGQSLGPTSVAPSALSTQPNTGFSTPTTATTVLNSRQTPTRSPRSTTVLNFTVDDFGLCSPRRAAGLPKFHAMYAWRKVHLSSSKTPNNRSDSPSSLANSLSSSTSSGEGGSPCRADLLDSSNKTMQHLMESGRVWNNTIRMKMRKKKRARISKNRHYHVPDDGLIVVYQMNTFETNSCKNGNTGSISNCVSCVKSVKARYEGNSDGDFSSIKSFSDSIPLRACPSFAGMGRSFYFFEVPLDSTVDGELVELMLSFDKRIVSKVEQIVVLSNDRRFISLASSLPWDEEQRIKKLKQQAQQKQLENATFKTTSTTTNTSTTPATASTITPTTVSKTARYSRANDVTTDSLPRNNDRNSLLSSLKSSGFKLSATQQEKLLNKIKSYKRSISPSFA